MKRSVKIIATMMSLICVFAFYGCNQDGALAKYKTSAKADIESYAQGKEQSNYTADNWTKVQDIVTEGKAAVDMAVDKTDIDNAVLAAKTDINAVPQDDGKPALALRLAYDFIKNEFEIGEEIKIKLHFATYVGREDLRQAASLAENQEEAFKEYSTAEICAVGKDRGMFTEDEEKGLLTNPLAHMSCVAIKEIEDFCWERFPYPLTSNSDDITLPRNLFTDEYGEILVLLKFFKFEQYSADYVSLIRIYYKIMDGKVFLGRQILW